MGVSYVSEMGGADESKWSPNTSCDGLESPQGGGMVLYPSGSSNFWLPDAIPDTPENRKLVAEVLQKTKSLLIEGCFAYRTDGNQHTSAFRFLLRDISGPSFVLNKNGESVAAWRFNSGLTGNDAN